MCSCGGSGTAPPLSPDSGGRPQCDTLSPGGIQARLEELQDFIAGQESGITEFDEALVKKLIEKITVFANHFTVEFKSGITIEIEA